MPVEIRNPASGGSVSGLTPGAVLFGSAGGTIGEDAANFFWNDTLNTLSIGSTDSTITIDGGSETVRFSVHDETSEYLYAAHHHSGTAAAAGRYIFARSRGTEASETVVSNNDLLGAVHFAGHDGTDYALASVIRCEVDGVPGSNDMPGRLIFLTTPDASATPTERMRIANSGLVTIGTGGTFTTATGAGDLGIAGDLETDGNVLLQGLVSVGTGGTFTLAIGAGDLAVSGDFEVDGQSRFDNTIGIFTAPTAATAVSLVSNSATVTNGMNVDMTLTPAATISASIMSFTGLDAATGAAALTTVNGIDIDVRYGRAAINQPTTYNQFAFKVSNYGVVGGTTITAGTYTYRGLFINAANAGANVSGGTHTMYDIETDAPPTGFPVGFRHYSIKMNDDAWMVDNRKLYFGTSQNDFISFDGTNWQFDCPSTTAAIIFNDTGTDTDFRIEGDTEANLFFCDSTNSAVGIGTNAPGSRLELEQVTTLGAGVGDGLAAALWLDPGYTGAFTVTRHNYLKCEQPSVAASAVVTDACLFWADAAAGTHKMVDAGTTKVSVGVVTQWIKCNINGTIAFIPSYSSKTS